MAKYKGIQGYTVQSLATDPTASSDTEGQLWYNSDSGAFKIAVAAGGTWASGNAANQARDTAAGMGTQTAALWAGGQLPAPYARTDLVEEYDGTSWTEVGDLNLARGLYTGGTGTVTAGLAMGGYTPAGSLAETEKYNGTAWTEVNNLNVARSTSGCGIQTAALAVAGPPGAIVEEYDGTSWTEIADINTARADFPTVGTTTAALFWGGDPPGETALTEQWNGTSWTEVGDLNTGRYGTGGAGTSTLALCIAGYDGTPPVTTFILTEAWNGTSWTEVADCAERRWHLGSAGTTQGVALKVGGAPIPFTAATEEWNDPVYSVKTVTVS